MPITPSRIKLLLEYKRHLLIWYLVSTCNLWSGAGVRGTGSWDFDEFKPMELKVTAIRDGSNVPPRTDVIRHAYRLNLARVAWIHGFEVHEVVPTSGADTNTAFVDAESALPYLLFHRSPATPASSSRDIRLNHTRPPHAFAGVNRTCVCGDVVVRRVSSTSLVFKGSRGSPLGSATWIDLQWSSSKDTRIEGIKVMGREIESADYNNLMGSINGSSCLEFYFDEEEYGFSNNTLENRTDTNITLTLQKPADIRTIIMYADDGGHYGNMSSFQAYLDMDDGDESCSAWIRCTGNQVIELGYGERDGAGEEGGGAGKFGDQLGNQSRNNPRSFRTYGIFHRTCSGVYGDSITFELPGEVSKPEIRSMAVYGVPVIADLICNRQRSKARESTTGKPTNYQHSTRPESRITRNPKITAIKVVNNRTILSSIVIPGNFGKAIIIINIILFLSTLIMMGIFYGIMYYKDSKAKREESEIVINIKTTASNRTYKKVGKKNTFLDQNPPKKFNQPMQIDRSEFLKEDTFM